MVLFHPASHSILLVLLLNAILRELYLLEGIYSSYCYSAQCREIIFAICHVIRFGKLLGCKVYDKEI